MKTGRSAARRTDRSRSLNKQLEKLIERATVDAYGESEQRMGFFTMMEENLAELRRALGGTDAAPAKNADEDAKR